LTNSQNKYQNKFYRNYVLGLMTLVYAVNFVDRQLLAILQDSIKADLGFSDTQLGVLTGFAFALFYVSAGVPIARWADRSNRRNIISLSIGVWSFMTAISGMAANYVHLLLARIGVGVGEAGCSPPAHSMISDIFPVEKRATALSTYSVGINIGIMFGFLLGGFLNEYYSWRVAFFVVGAPGLLIALIFRYTVAEPVRGWSENRQVDSTSASFSDVLKFIFKQRALVHLSIAASLSGFVGYALTNWSASFFIRSFSIPTAELGVWLAAGIGVFGSIGTFGWGYLCDRFGRNDKRLYFWLPGLSMLIALPIIIFNFSATDAQTALIIGLFPSMFTTGYLGAALAMFHGAVEPRMRATASALFFLILNIIGLGLGPTAIGAVSDYLNPSYGVESLRYAMLAVVPIVCLWSALHFYLAGRAWQKENS